MLGFQYCRIFHNKARERIVLRNADSYGCRDYLAWYIRSQAGISYRYQCSTWQFDRFYLLAAGWNDTAQPDKISISYSGIDQSSVERVESGWSLRCSLSKKILVRCPNHH